jgi:histidinol-phosphate aminotransferase
MRRQDVIRIAESFRQGIVVVDEAYIHFAGADSLISELPGLPNVVVLQTFSKAWAMAGLRVGLAFASLGVIELMNRVKPPYNVSGIVQRAIVDALRSNNEVDAWVDKTVSERSRLIYKLSELDLVKKIYPTDANFVLVRTIDPSSIYRHLLNEQIVVRDRSRVTLCEGCLRITVGTAEENERLLKALRNCGLTSAGI